MVNGTDALLNCLSLHASAEPPSLPSNPGIWTPWAPTPPASCHLTAVDVALDGAVILRLTNNNNCWYALSTERFRWQTRHTAGPTTPAGRRYLDSATNGWQFQPFVRIAKGTPWMTCVRSR